MEELELGDVLKQYRVTEIIDESVQYKQITISQTGDIKVRGFKKGSSIGRKRQFIIDLKNYPNTLLFVRQGVQKGGIGIAGKDIHGAIATENMPMFEIADRANPVYLDFYLKSSAFKNKVNSIEATGTAQKSIHERVLLKIKVNLPSRKEQDVLVKKLNEVNKNFIILSNEYLKQGENLIKLRQSILQDAVQGKLTKEWRIQNSNIESASGLLKRIKSEKAQLVKDNKIKKEKPLAPIDKDNVCREIPERWDCCKVNDITIIGTGATPLKSNQSYYGGEIPWYTSSATNDLFAEKPTVFITEKAIRETNCRIFPKGTLIVAMYGQGKTRGQVSEIVIPGATNQAVSALVFMNSSIDSKEYVKYYFQYIYLEIRELAEGGAQPNLSVGKIKNTIIPLPPQKEQKAIVQKVNLLLSNCDVLEQEISNSKANAEELMQSVLSELLGNEKGILADITPKKKENEISSREIKYNSKTLLMDLVTLLKENGKLHAEDLWKMSMYPDDIDNFYAELKRQIEDKKAIKESKEKGYLELA